MYPERAILKEKFLFCITINKNQINFQMDGYILQ